MDTNRGTILRGLFVQAWLKANCYAIGLIYGFDLGLKFAPLLFDLYMNSPVYRRTVDLGSSRVANALFEAAPEEFMELIELPDASNRIAELCAKGIEQHISSQFKNSDLTEMRNAVTSLLQQLQESLAGAEWDGKSTVADELDVDLETLESEPWRLGNVFPIHRLGLRKDEFSNLKDALNLGSGPDESGNDNYDQTLLSLIAQMGLSPQDVRGDGFRSDSPIYKWAGVKKSTPESSGTLEDATTAVVNLFKFLTQQENRRDMVKHMIGRKFRIDHNIGLGRGHEPIAQNGYDDTLAIEGFSETHAEYDEIDMRSYLDSELIPFLEELPPKQREAAEVYLEHYRSDRTIDEISEERGLKPVNVRNNFEAVKKRMAKK